MNTGSNQYYQAGMVAWGMYHMLNQFLGFFMMVLLLLSHIKFTFQVHSNVLVFCFNVLCFLRILCPRYRMLRSNSRRICTSVEIPRMG